MNKPCKHFLTLLAGSTLMLCSSGQAMAQTSLESQVDSGAELQVSALSSKSVVTQGTTAALRLQITNTSDAVAQDLVVCSRMNRYVTLADTNGGEWRGNNICWEIDQLGAGQTVKQTLTPRLDDDAVAGQQVLAQVKATGSNALSVSKKVNVRVKRQKSVRF